MVNIYGTRRGYNYKCVFWKRKTLNNGDSDEMIHQTKPSGVFYSKIISANYKDSQDLAGVFHYNNQNITIETNDAVNIEKDDLVMFMDKVWLVMKLNCSFVQKNAEFGCGNSASKKTIIELFSE